LNFWQSKFFFFAFSFVIITQEVVTGFHRIYVWTMGFFVLLHSFDRISPHFINVSIVSSCTLCQ
jgi:hypothetical protein